MNSTLFVVVLISAAPLPNECQLPPLRDVSALKSFAQRTGTLSVGLDSMATWCFDSDGNWTGGTKRKSSSPLGSAVDTTAMPVLECAKAVASCQKALSDLPVSQRQLLDDALGDLKRLYVGQKYVPKRSGLDERPNESASCDLRVKAELFAGAQARMDLARLASLAQNEYRTYRVWLTTESQSCARLVRERNAKNDPLKKSVDYDTPVDRQATGAMQLGALVTDAGVTVARSAALEVSVVPSVAVAVAADAGDALRKGDNVKSASVTLLEKWNRFAEVESTLSSDVDYTTAFLGSRELRDCKCVRTPAAGLVKRLQNAEESAQVENDDLKNTRCELCYLEAYSAWKRRSANQCALLPQLSDYEFQVLQKSDDANGLPARCVDLAKAKRAAKATAAQGPAAAASPIAAGKGGFLVTKKNEGAEAKAVAAASSGDPKNTVNVTVPAPTTPAATSSVNPNAEAFVRAKDYAPMPEREEGRLYLRVFMSSACVAEVNPGPIQVRTGDLLPLRMGSKNVTVSSPCGGLAEVYWGKQEKPKVSEMFARDQPLKLQFEAP